MNIVGYKSPLKKRSPMKLAPLAIAAIAAAPGIIKGVGSLFGMSARAEEQEKANEAYQNAKRNFENIQYTNPYENLQNPYENLQNPYTGLQNPYTENIYEDLGVNMRSADYLRDQQRQSQANIIQQMRGAAGGSGVAGLAQAMANLSDKQAREASARISDQEAANEKLRLKGADQRRKAEFGLDKLQRETSFGIDKLQRSTDFEIEQAIVDMHEKSYAGTQTGASAARMAGKSAMAAGRKKARAIHSKMFAVDEATRAKDKTHSAAKHDSNKLFRDVAFAPVHGFAPAAPTMEAGPSKAGLLLGLAGTGLQGYKDFKANTAPKVK